MLVMGLCLFGKRIVGVVFLGRREVKEARLACFPTCVSRAS